MVADLISGLAQGISAGPGRQAYSQHPVGRTRGWDPSFSPYRSASRRRSRR
jgi:hypothetical protein